MGVYIKGMEMPESCWECRLNYDHRYCMVTNSRIMDNGTKPDWCPLVEVKEPHGRLIDADALVNTVYYTNISESVKEFIADLIEIAPTVIEAEEG